jgi:putative PIN family toxin of toxin-antitoxin system
MKQVPVWTLDTNVLVSGLLSPDGPPGRLVDAVLARELRLALDDRIEKEYRTLVARPKFRFEASDLARVLGILSYQQHFTVTSSAGLVAAEPADTKFLEVASATAAKVLVTGNLKHYPRTGRGKVRVMTPAEAIVELQRSSDTPRV